MVSHFFVMSLRTRPKTRAWRWLSVACFSSVKNFGASSFSKFHHTRQKNPFATFKIVLQRAKKSLCNMSQFQTLFLPHRFIKIRQHWISHNSRIPQIWAKSKKLQKRANLTEKRRCSSKKPSAQELTNRTLISHERTSVHFLALPGSLFSFTEITKYTYISLI